jgi:EAL domain-containing protein (putative c-di-GMP-specific phosphodiesterase class I)
MSPSSGASSPSSLSGETGPEAAMVDRSLDRELLQTALAGATILIADDHEANVALLERILSMAGASVHATTEASAVASIFQEVEPDIVLLDLHMPGLDGVEVMAAIRALLDDDAFVPVIVLTADATVEARHAVLSSGADDFLTKPIDRTEVVLRTRNLLQTRALHRAVQEHNRMLRLEIEERAAEERTRAAALDAKRRQVLAILEGGRLRMVYQPVVHLASGAIMGYEALARFDVEPAMPPNDWFALAADVDLGVELELTALRAALDRFEDIGGDRVLAINASPALVTADAFHRLIVGQPLERLVLEITEHAHVSDYAALQAALVRAGGRRLRIAVDDAGAGFSSLSHILRLRPDIIKLDIHLVRAIDSDPVRRALTSALVTFAREIDSLLIAEGIETAAELACLRELGVPWGQGYFLARPGELPSR